MIGLPVVKPEYDRVAGRQANISMNKSITMIKIRKSITEAPSLNG